MLSKGFVLGVLFIGIILLCFMACSKDEENPIAPPQPPAAPEFVLKQIEFPQQLLNSTNQMAQQAIALVNSVLDFESSGCIFAPPNGAEAIKETSGEWEYKWAEGSLTQSLKISSVSGRDAWKLFWDGTQGGVTFNNWRFMDAVQSDDLSSGHITLFKAGTNETETEWVWYTLQTGDYKFIKQFYGDPPYKVEITIKQDLSGKIDKFKRSSSGNMVYDIKFAWKADGSGSFWTFEDGVQTSYGTW